MAKTFVAINDWCHKLVRDLTRSTPLEAAGPGGEGLIRYRIDPEGLPDSYYALAGCHALDGLPLVQVRAGCWRIREGCRGVVIKAAGGFDITRLDRRCWLDLRLRPGFPGPTMLAGELLSFGVGMLRGSGMASPHGRIQTRLERVFSRIWALHRDPNNPAEASKCVFCSTNVIYGDVFGELEQLWERRADIAFLDQVARALQPFRTWRDLPCSAQPPVNTQAVINLHLRSQRIWRTPPNSGRALLRRLEFILEHSILDSSAEGLRPGTARPLPDATGYDGWLGNPGGNLN
jgi:hypothetical protein